MSTIEDKLASNAIAHLHNINTLLRNNTLSQYYHAKCNLLEAQNKLKLPAKFKNTFLKCARCNANQSESHSTYHIETNQKSKNKLHLKLLKKKSKLTKFQKTFLKKNRNLHYGNTLIITCGLCKNKQIKLLNKPACPMKGNDKIIISPTKSKNRKKDKFYGLNKEAVLAAAKETLKTFESAPNKQQTQGITHVKPLLQHKTKKQVQRDVTKSKQKMSRLSEMLKKGTGRGKGVDLKQFLEETVIVLD